MMGATGWKPEFDLEAGITAAWSRLRSTHG
jgi:hypothetical protein